ncbi:MAG: O-antigen ligase family protein [Oligoflexia bacterium]|nr:O-antigen ligase family protein [Oligoflexia bacterium]
MALLDHQPPSVFEDTLRLAEVPSNLNATRESSGSRSLEQGLRIIPLRLRGFTRLFIFGSLIYMTFAFGGVHAANYLSFQALLFGLLAVYLMMCPTALYNGVVAPLKIGGTSRSPNGPVLSRSIAVFLAGLCIYPALQLALFSLRREAHPVLGFATAPLDRAAFFEQWITLVAFAAWFILLSSFVKDSPRRARIMFRVLALLTFAVSITALMHWFYDNGKLFWVFAPDYMFLSNRARWPFVNSNHLAHFLLPGIFILTGWLTINAQEIGRQIKDAASRDRRKFSNLIISSELQSRVIASAFLFAALGAALLCLFSSLSRGGWFGAAGGGIALLWLSAARRGEQDAGEPQQTLHLKRSKHHRQSGSRSSHGADALLGVLSRSRMVVKPLIVLMLCTFIYLFFNERGSDLFAERLDYGLLHSKDDMRWVMFADSLRMFWDHPVLGVGLGGWATSYPLYMERLLSGINPVYLHSDPLQLLCETGILGGLLMLGLVASVLAGVWRALPRVQDNLRIKLVSLASGLIALSIASFFDFSFHIPAIALSAGAYLALTAFYVERAWLTKLR